MQALGLIETRGLVAAIESADAMLKAAEVSLLEKTHVGGGLVSIAVTGDVAAVKAAVEAGGAAVRQLNSTLLMSQHVIPRPHQELDDVIVAATPLKEDPAETPVEQENNTDVIPAEPQTDTVEILDELHKEAVDKIVLEYGLEKVIAELRKLKVVKLRNLAREYKDFGIAGRLISKADKQMLITEFTSYYGQK
ncbi:BMC domain-containing protein [Sinanaerobacter chloroacetimidivorans]|uniref:BMC domain-containing protein n=1 Tax=Sinanaerobacter chloroacetimidivorans TaxID=2818044 RepID=A0A8J8B2M1_9FIRM|nr:BMC domain-containing protein [Sinanaerobacter chloroacetimidivorans]MBR0597385.1 BMC domain-containing protein [Sinanaerobacter chloroacetimidivorans]